MANIIISTHSKSDVNIYTHYFPIEEKEKDGHRVIVYTISIAGGDSISFHMTPEQFDTLAGKIEQDYVRHAMEEAERATSGQCYRCGMELTAEKYHTESDCNDYLVYRAG